MSNLADLLADVTVWPAADWQRLIDAAQTGYPPPVLSLNHAQITLTAEEVASLRLLLNVGSDAYIDHAHGPRLRALAARIGVRA